MSNRFIWCGLIAGTSRRIAFRTDYRIDAYGPPVKVNGETLGAVIGPFRTMRACKLVTQGGPFWTVAEAEKAAKVNAC